MFRPRALLAGVVLLGAATFIGTLPAGAAAGPTPCSSAQIIQITHMAFKPGTVFPGQSSTVQVAARNCTNQTLHASVIWLAQWIGPTTGLPPGCPAIDPIALPANFAPYGRASSKLTYLVPASCTARSLQATAEFSAGGAVLAKRSASLTITRPPA